MRSYLDFEKAVAELDAKVEELRAVQPEGDSGAVAEEIGRIQAKATQTLKDLYARIDLQQGIIMKRQGAKIELWDNLVALFKKKPSPAE